MVALTALFVSGRLQRMAFAALCIVAAQLLLALASCEPEPTPMLARAPIAGR